MNNARNPRALIVSLILPAALLAGEAIGPWAALATVVLGAILAWQLIPLFLPTLVAAALAGVVAGTAIVGVGFRVAMRIVALMEPSRIPEFSVGGTLFIIIMIGGIFGGIAGVVVCFARKGLGLGKIAGTLMSAGLIMTLVLIDRETRRELLHLGAGGLINIPMFTAISLGYGFATHWLFERLYQRMSASTEMVSV